MRGRAQCARPSHVRTGCIHRRPRFARRPVARRFARGAPITSPAADDLPEASTPPAAPAAAARHDRGSCARALLPRCRLRASPGRLLRPGSLGAVVRLGGYCMRRSPPWPSSLGPQPGLPGGPLPAGFPGLAPGGLLSALRPPAGGLRRGGARPGRVGRPAPRPLSWCSASVTSPGPTVPGCLGACAFPPGLGSVAAPGPCGPGVPPGGALRPGPLRGACWRRGAPRAAPSGAPASWPPARGGVAAQAPRGALRPPRLGFRPCGAGRGLKARCFASVGLLCFRRFLPNPLPVPPPLRGRGKRGADLSARAGIDLPGEAPPVPFRNLPQHGPRPRCAGALPPFFMSRNRSKIGAYAARRRSFHCTGG